jgi:hypothetical protein
MKARMPVRMDPCLKVVLITARNGATVHGSDATAYATP